MTERTCSIEGCTRKPHARTWCITHYTRWFRNGSIEHPRDGMTAEDIFWSRVNFLTDHGCWEWQGPLSPDGYGYATHDVYSEHHAHRVAYAYCAGEIEADLSLDHLCRNRRCVNPSHLEPVTTRENILRGTSPSAINARKTHCIHGHPFDGENVKVLPDGRRRCAACDRDTKARYRRRKRERLTA